MMAHCSVSDLLFIKINICLNMFCVSCNQLQGNCVITILFKSTVYIAFCILVCFIFHFSMVRQRRIIDEATVIVMSECSISLILSEFKMVHKFYQFSFE